MKTVRMAHCFAFVSSLGTFFLWSATSVAAPQAEQSAPAFKVFVSDLVTPVVSTALRDLPAARLDQIKPRVTRPRVTHPSLGLGIEEDVASPILGLPMEPNRAPDKRTPNPLQMFAGIPFSGSHPPDPVGDVGPNHYVQALNTLIAVFDKNGNQLVAPHQMGDIWASLGGDCAGDGGDPVVLYDTMADRWFLSQLGQNQNSICIAVSKTPDPGGQYNTYRFGAPSLPDYLKFGIWPDAYYMGSNENSYTAYAFDRAKIIAGQPATFQRFAGETNLLMPADLDGATLPPAGSPGLFYTFKDDVEHGGQDRLEVFEFKVDWVTPGNSTFQLKDSMPIQPFQYTVCGAFNFNCIPQMNTNQRLDPVSEWPMFRLQYRNFGAYQTLVGNFTTDVDNTNHAGIRWFELRKMGAAWTLRQEGTHAPDALHRFMGSIAMDQVGNIAIGYTASGTTSFPDVRYATRNAADTLGTLQAEVTLQASNGSQIGVERWGDYSSMNVDPSDDCTFFYTMEYMPSQGSSWNTVVGKFRMPDCGGKPNGSMCSGAGGCKSGFCSDGICCATDCGTDPQDCQACSVAAGSTADGTCVAVGGGKACRAAAGPCDSEEKCDGTSKACPTDLFLGSTTVCRPPAAGCDAPEFCSGSDATCPVDVLIAKAGAVCRAGEDSCDPDETCDGITNVCPADVLAEDGTKCAEGGTCAAGTCKPPLKLDPKDDSSCGCRIPGGENEDRGHAAAFLMLAGLAVAGGIRRRGRSAR